ncbi:MAG: hypothetical protein JWP50_1752 [Phenylobacterium sp.]|nr:hypothetical protein [Phenylobacterium sp.]
MAPQTSPFVPAKAGMQVIPIIVRGCIWAPAFAGVSGGLL